MAAPITLRDATEVMRRTPELQDLAVVLDRWAERNSVSVLESVDGIWGPKGVASKINYGDLADRILSMLADAADDIRRARDLVEEIQE